MVLSGLVGFLGAFAYPTSLALLNPSMPPGRRSQLMGLWGTAGPLGNIAGSTAAYATLGGLGWRISFCLPAALVIPISASNPSPITLADHPRRSPSPLTLTLTLTLILTQRSSSGEPST